LKRIAVTDPLRVVSKTTKQWANFLNAFCSLRQPGWLKHLVATKAQEGMPALEIMEAERCVS